MSAWDYWFDEMEREELERGPGPERPAPTKREGRKPCDRCGRVHYFTADYGTGPFVCERAEKGTAA